MNLTEHLQDWSFDRVETDPGWQEWVRLGIEWDLRVLVNHDPDRPSVLIEKYGRDVDQITGVTVRPYHDPVVISIIEGWL